VCVCVYVRCVSVYKYVKLYTCCESGPDEARAELHGYIYIYIYYIYMDMYVCVYICI
jgi:hypothetical protein